MGTIETERRGRIWVISIHRPEKKNALTREMYEALNSALDTAGDDDAIRVVLVTGSQGCFTAGNDLQDFMNDPPVDESSPVLQFLERLRTFEKPLVAAVSGPAVGIGSTLLLHADLAYADESARFKMPFVPLGLVPEGGSSLLLPRALGHRRAAELLLLGESFDAETARALGLINEKVDGDVIAHALKRCEQLAKRPPRAVVAGKRLMKAPLRDELARVMRAEAEEFARALRSPEAMEAFRAFFEKREPNFD